MSKIQTIVRVRSAARRVKNTLKKRQRCNLLNIMMTNYAVTYDYNAVIIMPSII